MYLADREDIESFLGPLIDKLVIPFAGRMPWQFGDF
jgi:hypothetical protein